MEETHPSYFFFMKPYGYVWQLQWTDCSGCISLIISLVGVGLFLASVVCIPCIHLHTPKPHNKRCVSVGRRMTMWMTMWPPAIAFRLVVASVQLGDWASRESAGKHCLFSFLLVLRCDKYIIWQSSTSTCMWCLYDLYIYIYDLYGISMNIYQRHFIWWFWIHDTGGALRQACTMPTQWSWTPLSVPWSSARSCASSAARWCPSARISPFGRILGPLFLHLC